MSTEQITVKVPEGFIERTVSGADGRLFVHASLPLAICASDEGDLSLFHVQWDDEESEKSRNHPDHFFPAIALI